MRVISSTPHFRGLIYRCLSLTNAVGFHSRTGVATFQLCQVAVPLASLHWLDVRFRRVIALRWRLQGIANMGFVFSLHERFSRTCPGATRENPKILRARRGLTTARAPAPLGPNLKEGRAGRNLPASTAELSFGLSLESPEGKYPQGKFDKLGAAARAFTLPLVQDLPVARDGPRGDRHRRGLLSGHTIV